MDNLSREALLEILVKPKNALIKQYIKLFEMDGIKLRIEQDVLELIVDTSIKFKLGARGLRTICETIMLDAMYDSPSNDENEVVIDLKYAKEKLKNFTGTL